MSQEGTVLLFNTFDNGDIRLEEGLFVMESGLEGAAYLALFGGNEDDDGSEGNNLEWWGNKSEVLQSRKYQSETQHLLRSIPATVNNLLRVQQAAERDLAFFLEDNIASSVEVLVTIPALNWVSIAITINAEGQEQDFEFVENWKAAV